MKHETGTDLRWALYLDMPVRRLMGMSLRPRRLLAAACLGSLLIVTALVTLGGSPRALVHSGSWPPRSSNRGLLVSDKISGFFNLTGAVVNSLGIHKRYTHRVKVSLVHSFSPQTEKHFREMMIDPRRDEHKIYANSPAILQDETGEITTVMRIWLEKEVWGMIEKNPTNTFADNYFYAQTFDSRMNPLTDGHVIGIPTPIQWSIGDGPIEPRIFRVNGTTYLTFNTGVFDENHRALDSTFVWDLDHSASFFPRIDGGSPMIKHHQDSVPRDKHWSAVVNGSRLYFTYNLDPLRVLECRLRGSARCHFVLKEGPEDYVFQNAKDSVRGGTPFVLYRYPYYITVAHGTFFQSCPTNASRCDWTRFYSTHLIVMTIEPSFRILYISGNIPYPPSTLQLPIVRFRFIDRPFFFPVGLLLENADSIIVGGHINDHSSVLYRITGVAEILEEVIAYNRRYGSVAGPVLGKLHEYARLEVERETGLKFHHD